MGAARECAWVAVIDGKIYVMKGVRPDQESHWAEVFDPVIGRWEAVPTPFRGLDDRYSVCQVVDGKICVRMERGDLEEFRFDPATKEWKVFDSELRSRPDRPTCVVDGVLYCCDRGTTNYLCNAKGTIEVFDERNGVWKVVKGVAEKMPKWMVEPRIVNFEGRLVMVWGQLGNGNAKWYGCGLKTEVWCAEIEVNNDGDGDWFGHVHCSERLLSLPDPTLTMPEGPVLIIFGFFYVAACLSASL